MHKVETKCFSVHKDDDDDDDYDEGDTPGCSLTSLNKKTKKPNNNNNKKRFIFIYLLTCNVYSQHKHFTHSLMFLSYVCSPRCLSDLFYRLVLFIRGATHVSYFPSSRIQNIHITQSFLLLLFLLLLLLFFFFLLFLFLLLHLPALSTSTVFTSLPPSLPPTLPPFSLSRSAH